ncbi:MAG: hypothetical protein ACI97A_000710 [Planctomycetota bacterium]|jgi:hypothetical protein
MAAKAGLRARKGMVRLSGEIRRARKNKRLAITFRVTENSAQGKYPSAGSCCGEIRSQQPKNVHDDAVIQIRITVEGMAPVSFFLEKSRPAKARPARIEVTMNVVVTINQ